MASQELILSLPGRPATVRREGWTEFVAVHDQAYLRAKRSWKRALAEAHPDRSGKSGYLFRDKMRSFRAWVLRERKYYWDLGLMPPDWRGSLIPPPGYAEANRSGKVMAGIEAGQP